MNKKIIYKWTNRYNENEPDNGFLQETDYIVTDGVYDFECYLQDTLPNRNAHYEKCGNIYFVLDASDERTGEAFLIWDEIDTDEPID